MAEDSKKGTGKESKNSSDSDTHKIRNNKGNRILEFFQISKNSHLQMILTLKNQKITIKNPIINLLKTLKVPKNLNHQKIQIKR